MAGFGVGQYLVSHAKNQLRIRNVSLMAQIKATKDSLDDDSVAYVKWLAMKLPELKNQDLSYPTFSVTASNVSGLSPFSNQEWKKNIEVKVPDSTFVKIVYPNPGKSIPKVFIRIIVYPYPNKVTMWKIRLLEETKIIAEDSLFVKILKGDKPRNLAITCGEINWYECTPGIIKIATILPNNDVVVELKESSISTFVFKYKLSFPN